MKCPNYRYLLSAAVTLSIMTTALDTQAADITKYDVAVTDKQCQPMNLTVPAGKVQFIIRNKSMRGLEWEILDGVMVVAERENIAPGFMQKMTVKLEPGEYDMTCGLLTNPRGKLVVTKDANAEPYRITATDLIAPIAEYKFYVSMETRALVEETKAFTDAVRAGDIAKAKALYVPARMHYERIEPIAELFSDLDASIDAREDNFAQGTDDPHFSGFHRLEYALWKQQDLSQATAYADQLDKDVNTLKTRIHDLTFPPETVVGGAAALIEEVAASKISGEEDRYAHTDLADFQANIEGARKIFNLFNPLLTKVNEPLAKRINSNLKAVEDRLANYRTADGFATYDKLTDSDRRKLQGPITVLAEDLAKLRGSLGI